MRSTWILAAIALFVVVQLIVVCYLYWPRKTGPGGCVSGEQPLIYIYELPGSADAWPDAYTHHRLSIEKEFAANYGAGTVVNVSQGLHRTHQYMLFNIFLQRLLVSPHRTRDPKKASHFFIPYDIGMDASTRKSDGALVSTSCPRLPLVLAHLAQSPYFHRHGGADHFLIYSINHMMLFFANAACSQLLQLCLNCSKLSIDHYDEQVYPELRSMPYLTQNWHSIPFPSDYHRSQLSTHLPWESAASRPTALAFMGSTQVTARKQQELRVKILKECERLGDDCVSVRLASHSSNAAYGVRAYQTSRLCLLPGGDFPTRKAFLDAMLSGCIPVTFQLFAAQKQWHRHWQSAEQAMRCTVYFPMEQALRNISLAMAYFMELSHDEEFLKEKRKCIAEVGNRFQYSLPSASSDGCRDGSSGPDAFDVALEVLNDKRDAG